MLMNYDPCETDEESFYTSSTNLQQEVAVIEKHYDNLHDTGDQTFPYKTKNYKRDMDSPAIPGEARIGQSNCLLCKNSTELYYHINSESVIKLKESTKKLLCVLEEIQSKTHGKQLDSFETNYNFSQYLKPISSSKEIPSATDLVNTKALKNLEIQTHTLQSIFILDEDDDCSVYKRLTRKCNCLNRFEYNDFIIHFNEETKYRTSLTGEIIKNMRILKKFLYMNGKYTHNALVFLNEGLSESSHTEKVEITQGCAHADICNIFDEYSIITMYVSWPCKNGFYGSVVTQNLVSSFINKLAQLEEGRRYLNYSSKISNDIKKVIRKRSSFLEIETVESLNATLNLLQPSLIQNKNVTYYCRPVDEGIEKKTINALIDHRKYMTLDEVIAHLDILNNISSRENSNCEMMMCFPSLLILFKSLLVEYDNSEMNILLTSILNNIVSKNIVKEKEKKLPKTLISADIATEPIRMKNETSQHPPKKPNARKINKSKVGLGVAPNKYRNPSKRKVSDRSADWEFTNINQSRKFNKEKARSSVIVVPIEK